MPCMTVFAQDEALSYTQDMTSPGAQLLDLDELSAYLAVLQAFNASRTFPRTAWSVLRHRRGSRSERDI